MRLSQIDSCSLIRLSVNEGKESIAAMQNNASLTIQTNIKSEAKDPKINPQSKDLAAEWNMLHKNGGIQSPPINVDAHSGQTETQGLGQNSSMQNRARIPLALRNNRAKISISTPSK